MSPPRSAPRRRRALAGAIVIVAAFGGVACGDDDDDAATPAGPTTTAESAFADYCEAEFKAEVYFGEGPDVDFGSATPEQIAAANQAFLQGAKPLVDALVPLIPAEIKAPSDVQLGVFNQVLAGTANPEEAFDTPEVTAAEEKVHAFDLENCGWGKADVSGTDYAFSGLPASLTAGPTSIEFSNDGKELHELALLAKKPGVTKSFDELLTLGPPAIFGEAPPASFMIVPAGESDFVVVDLAPGSYLAVCFIPQGTLTMETEVPEGAKSHAELGMKQEFTVA